MSVKTNPGSDVYIHHVPSMVKSEALHVHVGVSKKGHKGSSKPMSQFHYKACLQRKTSSGTTRDADSDDVQLALAEMLVLM